MPSIHFWGKETMKLTHTQALMQSMAQNQQLDSWAVWVGKSGKEQLIMSENVNEDTYFDVASMGKILVTTPLILKLVGENRIRLTDTLGDFFPNAPRDKRDLTVRQLLTHSSGIIRVPIPEEIGLQGHDAVADHILASKIAFLPDEKVVYSCNGYILLGFIVEKMYGMTLDQAFYQYLANPLGLERARFNIDIHEENAAVCYTRKEVGKFRADDDNVCHMQGVAGSGAQFFSVGAIRKFIQAVMEKDERLYPKNLFAQAEMNWTSQFSDEGRGLGYLVTTDTYQQTQKLFPVGSFGHTGYTGMSMFMNREEDMFAIILTNATRFANMKSGFRGFNYVESIEKMREAVNNEIYRDLVEQNLI